jgi:ADP-ribose pyrophosphatase YjhB (NUDIX family)/ribosomal protein S18 acetylase RimI-like enzyme
MPTPEFVLSLREHVGHDLLWLSGVTGVVLDDAGRLLLGRRADTGDWALPSGILEPGEQPADGLAREVEEEACVRVRVEALTSVWTQPEVRYPNGDRSRYLDLCFLCRHVSGEPGVGDGELTEVGWFGRDNLPEGLRPSSTVKIERALASEGRAWFEGRSPESPAGQGSLPYAAGPATLRRARREDVADIVALIANDQLGATREDPGDLAAYLGAFAAIDADPAHSLVVAERDGRVVGTLQLSIIPGLARRGALRGQLEAVRVAEGQRGHGLGEAMVRWAVEESRRRGCALVQLTTDKSRTEAHRFYERLGFERTHEGMKLRL